jgi:hypothetical protein
MSPGRPDSLVTRSGKVHSFETLSAINPKRNMMALLWRIELVDRMER